MTQPPPFAPSKSDFFQIIWGSIGSICAGVLPKAGAISEKSIWRRTAIYTPLR
jgi:hypothetical protein